MARCASGGERGRGGTRWQCCQREPVPRCSPWNPAPGLQGCSESASKSRMQRAALPCTLCALFPAVNALFINSPRPTARGTALWKSPGASYSCALPLQTGPQLIKMTVPVVIWYVEFHLSYRRCTCHQGVQVPPHLPTLMSCHIK